MDNLVYNILLTLCWLIKETSNENELMHSYGSRNNHDDKLRPFYNICRFWRIILFYIICHFQVSIQY